MGDELSVAALGLDDGNDAGRLSVRVPGHEAVGQVAMLDSVAVLDTLHAVFLHHHPTEAACDERFYVLVTHVRMVRQGHLRGRKPLDPAYGVQSEDCGEVVLPGLDVEAVILYGRRRSHGVTPGRPQPLYTATVGWIAGDRFEEIEDIVQAHVA